MQILERERELQREKEERERERERCESVDYRKMKGNCEDEFLYRIRQNKEEPARVCVVK